MIDGRPFRVLFYQFFPGGGIGRYTHELLTVLCSGEAVDVELVCSPAFQWLGEATYPTWPGLYDLRHSVPLVRRSRFLVGQVLSPRRLLRRARVQGADILHLSNINHISYPLWRRALRRTGARLVATVHDVTRRVAVVNRTYEDAELKRFYRDADALLVHSDAQRSELVSWAGVAHQRVHVVPHGPFDYGLPRRSRAEALMQWGIPDDRQVALVFGRVRDDKNLDLFLDAVRGRDDLHVLVAGTASSGHRPFSHYRRAVTERGMVAQVTFLEGRVPEHEVSDLFNAADWVALPYSRTFTSQSGVLNVALQHRRPVLVSDSPTFAETLEGIDVGELVEPDNGSALAASVARMMSRVAGGARFDFDAYLSRNSWAENARRTEEIYGAVIGRRG